MDLLKLLITIPLTFVLLEYTEAADDIIFTVDVNVDGWEKMLMKLVKGKSHF